ncbi:hypothetical protein SCB49_14430 [unidentified eubacterium SCB49]|nr:hypothetical protein SCB49_14430 [unidentified eubacterium SCB49]
MQIQKNLPYYLTVLGIFSCLKFSFTLANNNNLQFLLKPTNKLVGFLTNSHSVFFSNKGYYFENLNILIDKHCSGFNFWVLSFLIFSYLLLKYFNKRIYKIATIPLALTTAYLLTLFVNTSRIFVAIIIQDYTKNTVLEQQDVLHEIIGVITNLTFLMLTYLLVEKLLIFKQNNAKHT